MTRKTLLSLLLVAIAGGMVQDVRAQRAAPLRWIPSQRMDIDCDGALDQILVASDGTHFFVGAVLGPIGPDSRASIVRFLLRGMSQDSFCDAFQSLEPEPVVSEAALAGLVMEPEGYPSSAHCQELRLVAGECDSFHIYWNATKGELTWWRP